MKINQIICGDALKIMKSFPNKTFDAIITDPPYNINPPSVINRKGGKFGISKSVFENLVKEETVIRSVRFEDWLPLAIDKLKENGVLITMCSKEDISNICYFLKNRGLKIRHVGVWVKANPVPQIRKVQWMSAWEPFIIATMNKGTSHHYNYKEGQMKDVIITPICQGKERTEHPTQKPLSLFIPLVKWWTFKGDLVLDPFLGSGTTAVACRMLDRYFIGIELNPKYCRLAESRLKPFLAQKKLTIFNEVNGK